MKPEMLDMQINLKVTDKVFDGNIREVLNINEAALSEEFVKQPSLFAWFAALAEIANAEVESKKMAVSLLRANLDAEKRTELSTSGKITESMVDSAITKDKRFQVASEELIESGRQFGILKAMVRALEQRKDMLIQLGGMKRQEMFLSDFGINIDKIKK